MYQTLDMLAKRISQGFALLGGLVLLFLIVLTSFSVIGRSLAPLDLGQISGDFELVELGMGFVVFSFLPWTQYSRGHARVDMLEPFFGLTFNAILDLIADLMVTAVAILLTWRLWLGMLDKRSYHETTFILQLEIWQAYLLGFAGACGFVVISLFCVYRSIRQFGGLA